MTRFPHAKLTDGVVSRSADAQKTVKAVSRNLCESTSPSAIDNWGVEHPTCGVWHMTCGLRLWTVASETRPWPVNRPYVGKTQNAGSALNPVPPGPAGGHPSDGILPTLGKKRTGERARIASTPAPTEKSGPGVLRA